MTSPHAITGDDVTLRPVELPKDSQFLLELYISVREDLAGLPLEPAYLRKMMLLQFEGQRATYEHDYPSARHDLVLYRDERVGRLMVERGPGRIHGIDLSVLPTYRSLGIGSVVLNRLFAESTSAGVDFVFSVLKSNRAMNLYRRLGCVVEGENATHFRVIWRPEPK